MYDNDNQLVHVHTTGLRADQQWSYHCVGYW